MTALPIRKVEGAMLHVKFQWCFWTTSSFEDSPTDFTKL